MATTTHSYTPPSNTTCWTAGEVEAAMWCNVQQPNYATPVLVGYDCMAATITNTTPRRPPLAHQLRRAAGISLFREEGANHPS